MLSAVCSETAVKGKLIVQSIRIVQSRNYLTRLKMTGFVLTQNLVVVMML